MIEWQPIDTAPKDGTQILALYHDLWFSVETSMAVSWWDQQFHCWWAGVKYLSHHRPRNIPTHWMPLPQHPTQIDGGAGG